MLMRTAVQHARWAGIAVSAFAAMTLGACGSSSKSTSSAGPSKGGHALSLTIRESGKTAAYTGPGSAAGGLVTISLTNKGSMPHGAQFVRITGNHSVPQALQGLGASMRSGKTPAWLRAEGGPATAYPGQTTSATQNLPAGKYLIADLGGPSNGPPAYTQLAVSGPSSSGSLPSAPATVTAAANGKDKYKWQLSGAPLATGQNRITFTSKGKATLHVLSAVRIVGHPSRQKLINALKSNGPPPAFVDTSSFAGTGALDSGKSQVTSLTFAKPGTYVLFCPLHDRDGGKPHFEEGLLKTITVK
jgi:plastocyanin